MEARHSLLSGFGSPYSRPAQGGCQAHRAMSLSSPAHLLLSLAQTCTAILTQSCVTDTGFGTENTEKSKTDYQLSMRANFLGREQVCVCGQVYLCPVSGLKRCR
jgi:hypothetical protein